MGAAEKYSRYRWKEGKERDLWSFVDGKIKEGASVTAALKEFGKRHNMSWLTARWKYYQVRKQRGMLENVPVPEAAAPGAPLSRDEEDFLGYLSEWVSSSREDGQDIVPFIKGLSRMAALSRESSRLRTERDHRQAALREDSVVLMDVSRFLNEWLSQSQVDRVACLKDFSERLRAETAKIAAVGERLATVS